MRLIITSFLVTAACKAGGRNAARGRTRKATIRTWESRSLAISTAKIIPREKRGRLNRRKSRLLPWFNFAAGLRTATTSPCNISCVTVILPARDVQVTGSRSARFYSNSRPPRPKAQSREIDDAVRCLFISLVLAALPTNLVAAPGRIPQSGRATGGEPFRSFRLLDQKLTLLSNQQSALKAALGAGRVNSSSNNSSSASATAILRRMSSTTTAIDCIAGRLERLYQSRRESFGVRMFKILRSRARTVQRDVSSVRRARMPSDATVAGERLEEHLVSLVTQFQAAAGGYGATHCLPGKRICCQP